MANKTKVFLVLRYESGVKSGLTRNITHLTARLGKRIKLQVEERKLVACLTNLWKVLFIIFSWFCLHSVTLVALLQQ
jgi:hypothetical protein